DHDGDDHDGDEHVGDEHVGDEQAQVNATDTGSDANWDRGQADHRDGGNDGLDRAQIERVARFRREFVVGREFVARHVQALQELHPGAERLADGVRLAVEADGTTITITISDDGELEADGGRAAATKALETYGKLLRAAVDDVEFLRLAVPRVGIFDF